MQEYEAAIAPLKQALFTQLFASLPTSTDTDTSSSSSSGAFSVLEVGIGTGPNFRFYPANSSSQQQQQQQQEGYVVTGLEPNPAMWQYTQQAAEAAGLSQQQLRLVAADAQQMPFEQDSFDAAVVTLVSVLVQEIVVFRKVCSLRHSAGNKCMLIHLNNLTHCCRDTLSLYV
jgi:hypothetical protein